MSKKFKELNIQRTSNVINKWASELNSDFSNEKYKWLTNTLKDVQHLHLSWICKLKLYGGPISPWQKVYSQENKQTKTANAATVQGKRTPTQE